MAGTITGGRRAAQSNYKRHGSDFYRVIGSEGGRKSRGGGFASMDYQKHREASRKGGQRSRRTKVGSK